MQKLIKSERKQATPPGIPIAVVVAFSVVIIVPVAPTSDYSVIPLGFIALALAVLGLLDQSWFALIAVPFVILIIADLLRNSFWRSVLFSIGSALLFVEWLITVREIEHT